MIESLESRQLLTTLTVNSLADNTTAGDGLVTLREAIIAAETDATTDLGQTGSGFDRINFDNSLVTSGDVAIKLTMFDTGVDAGEFGATAFRIATSVSIEGLPGNNGITIQRDATAGNFRLFDVTSTGQLWLSRLTLSNGVAQGGNGTQGGGGAAGMGGAIINRGGKLNIDSSTLTGNTGRGGNGGDEPSAGGGGGVGANGAFGNGVVGGGPNPGAIGLSGGPSGNGTSGSAGGIGGGGGAGGSGGDGLPGHAGGSGAAGGSGGFGGGAGAGGISGNGSSSTTTGVPGQNGGPAGNGAMGGFGGGGSGGGRGGAGGDAIDEGASGTGGVGGDGGSGGFGGGGGAAGQGGGGTFSGSPGAVGTAGFGASPGGSSTTSGGGGGGGAGMGGAIFNDGGTVNITNSTLEGNMAIGGPGADLGGNGAGLGGGIFNRNGNLTVNSSTISGYTFGDGSGSGGVFNLADGAPASLVMNNTIVAGPVGATKDLVSMAVGSTASATGTNNLIVSQSGGEFVNTLTAHPQLSGLADNGGPTMTMALPYGSPSHNAGNNAATFSLGNFDQRGAPFLRESEGVVDIGAYEFTNAPPVAFNDLNGLPVPVGNEILVDNSGMGAQSVLTELSSGGFVVAWTHIKQTNPDPAMLEHEIRAQVFDSAGGKVGGEILVNTTTGNLNAPSIAPLASGGFVAVFTDESPAGGPANAAAIHAQVFDATGGKVGGEIQVNTAITPRQSQRTDVAALTGGGFVVAFETVTSNMDEPPVFTAWAQVFDASGGKVGDEIRVSATAQDGPLAQVTALSDGTFVISHWRADRANSSLSLHAQLFDATGGKRNDEFLIHSTTLNASRRPAITSLSGGGFVAVFEDFGHTSGDPSDGAVLAQIFSGDEPLSGKFLVNTTTDGKQSTPAVTAMLGGGFVVAFEDESQSGGATLNKSVRAQVFDARGKKVGSEILANTTTHRREFAPDLTALSGGGFAVAFKAIQNSGNTSVAERVQVFDGKGKKVGNELLVNTTTLGDPRTPPIAGLSGGGFAAVFNPSQRTEIRAKVFELRTPTSEPISWDLTANAPDADGDILVVNRINNNLVLAG